MASAGLRRELECSICLSLYTDPVTLRCGHNFCWVCIDQVLNAQDGSAVYSCPECREEFQERPELRRNITLCNVVENFLTTQPNQEEITGIRCTFCIHSPVAAVKSCLHCEASLCDNHLRVHSKSAEHVLTEPTTNLENRRCSVHKKVLEYYCSKDNACICVSCSLIGQHQGHKMEALDEASEKKKEKLKNVFQKFITQKGETEERVRSLEEQRRKAQEKASGEVERVTALFIDIRRRLDDLEKMVLSEISRREQQMSLSLSDVIQKLEVKNVELSKKMRHIEELCNMTDPLTVLQEPDTGDLCDPEEEEGDEDSGGHDGGDEVQWGHEVDDDNPGGHDGGDEDTWGHDGGDEDIGGHDGGDEDIGGHDGGDEDIGGHDGGDEDTWEHDDDTWRHDEDEDMWGHDRDYEYSWGHNSDDEDSWGHDGDDEDSWGHDEETGGHEGSDRGAELISQLSHTLSDMIRDVTFYVQDPADILLDVTTAGDFILISDDLKSATCTGISQNQSETSERFQDYNQVMSGRGFTSGRHYWDVEISGSGEGWVGMCYPSIDRRGHHSDITDNNNYWGLYAGWGSNNQYLVRQDSEEIQIPHQISSDRVRICLDYEAGRLSFYELCDPIRHLHTFTATFTEPLHAGLCVYGGYIKILGSSS